MRQSQAQSAITSSAVVVAALYGFRKLLEPEQPEPDAKAGPEDLIGFGPMPPFGVFVVGWGFSFMTLAVLATWQPDLAGYFAVLIMLGALMGNGVPVSAHVTEKLRGSGKKLTAEQVEDSANPTVPVAYFSNGAAPAAVSTNSPHAGVVV